MISSLWWTSMYHNYNPNILHSVVMPSYTTSLWNSLVMIMIMLVVVDLLNVLFFDFIALFVIFYFHFGDNFYYSCISLFWIIAHIYRAKNINIFIHYLMFAACLHQLFYDFYWMYCLKGNKNNWLFATTIFRYNLFKKICRFLLLSTQISGY